jgi:uncharacterized membrane protein
MYKKFNLSSSNFKIFEKIILFFIALIIILMPILKVYTLHSTYFDLGIFQSVGYNLQSGTNSANIFSAGHVFGYFPLFEGLIKYFPIYYGEYILVVLQGFLLVVPLIFLYRKFGVLICFAYLGYAPLWWNALFDFHFDHLVVPLLMLFYLAFLERNIFLAVLSAMLIAFVKEVYALQSMACGFMLICSIFLKKELWGDCCKLQLNNKLSLWGLFLIVFGGVYFIFSTHYLIPFFNYDGDQGFHGGEAFGWLGDSIGEILYKIFLRLDIIFYDIISTPKKLIFIGLLFGLLAFIPLFSPLFLIPALPIIFIALLSHSSNHYDPSSHYTAGVIMPMIFAFNFAIPRVRKFFETTSRVLFKVLILLSLNRIHLILIFLSKKNYLFNTIFFTWILVGNIVFSPSPVSRFFWSNKIWSTTWSSYIPSDRDQMIKSALEKFIPFDPAASISTQNTVNWGYISRREGYFPFPMGVFEPQALLSKSTRTWDDFYKFLLSGLRSKENFPRSYADFIVLDFKRPYFILDKGCNWAYGECQDKNIEKKFLYIVDQARNNYYPIYENDGFLILQRSSK